MLNSIPYPHDRSVPVASVLLLFRTRGWSDDCYDAPSRFRCGGSGSKNIHLDADFYAAAVRRQRNQLKLTTVPETLRPGVKPPPHGVSVAEWNVATERERKPLVDRSRS